MLDFHTFITLIITSDDSSKHRYLENIKDSLQDISNERITSDCLLLNGHDTINIDTSLELISLGENFTLTMWVYPYEGKFNLFATISLVNNKKMTKQVVFGQ